jgi:SEC-C motif-containing protein
MRSRYSAYVKSAVNYIYDTTHPSKREGLDKKQSAVWAKNFEWQSLEILGTQAGQINDQNGMVEFIARYRNKGKACRHHEIAQFKKENDRWYFVDGHAPKPVQSIRKGPKIGRNDPCPCGSGKKYKKCCG